MGELRLDQPPGEFDQEPSISVIAQDSMNLLDVISDAFSEFEGDDCPHAGRTDQDLMGQKDKKQPVSSDHRKIDSRGRFRGADVRGYARMRKAMLEREKREKEEGT